jgi:sigma-B regulation protein RsbU (phosphoserine phosphatase)
MTTAQQPPVAPASAASGIRAGARARGDWLDQTLAGVLGQVRKLVQVDGAAFLLVDRAREQIEPAAVWYATDEVKAALEPMISRRYDRERPGLTEVAIERGRPLLLPRIEDWEASEELRQRTELSIGKLRAEGAWAVFRGSSIIACPVRTALGETLGALIVVSVRRRPLGRGDLERVEVLADMAALALERSERLDAEARRAHEELLLKRAAQEVSSSLEHDEVYECIVEQAVQLTGATKALLTRMQTGSPELAYAAGVGMSPELADVRHRLDGSMLGHVASTRTPSRSRPDGDAEWRDSGLPEAEGVRSFVHVPIELGPRLFGVLSVGHEEPDRFDRDDVDVLVKHARSSAAAIANSMDFERERHLARALTVGFVPESLPTLPGYEVGLVYEPTANQEAGGDVYGAWRLPSGDVGILVGDVAGKGTATAALSSMTRFFIEARSWDDVSPAQVLDQANTMLCNRLPADTFVTAFFGLLSPEGLRYSNAGHLAPMLVAADGSSVSELEGRGLPLGIDASSAYDEHELDLAAGELLVGYTDGLVEARRSGELYGSERLAATVGRLAPGSCPDELARRVHDTVRDWADGLTDDAVVLALRRGGDGPAA